MKSYESLKKYIDCRICKERQLEYIRNNRLSLISIDEQEPSIVLYAKIRYNLFKGVVIKITKTLREKNIDPIHFKGIILSNYLYELPYQRICGDIDFYVSSERYNEAIQALVKNGFFIQKESDGHHIILNYLGIPIEMHSTYFHPNDKLAFLPQKKHLQQILIDDYALTTFDATFQLIYLVLHYFVHVKKGGKYTNKAILLQWYRYGNVMETIRLLDISLLIEKYGNTIDWELCARELIQVANSEEFQLLLREIEDVFGKIFPSKFIDIVLNKNPGDYKYSFFRRILSDTNRKYDEIVAEIVHHNSQTYMCGNKKPSVCKFIVDEFDDNKTCTHVLSGVPPLNYRDLSFSFDFWIEQKELRFIINVNDDILTYLQDGVFPNDYEAISYCDGFSINFAPAGRKYSFNRIFFFLTKDIADNRFLSVYDIVNNPIPLNDIIKCKFNPQTGGYMAEVSIPLEYLNVHDNDVAFYFNVLVNDCDDETGCNTVLAFDATEDALDSCVSYPIIRFTEF